MDSPRDDTKTKIKTKKRRFLSELRSTHLLARQTVQRSPDHRLLVAREEVNAIVLDLAGIGDRPVRG
jgi:hypothetical protein